MQTEIWTPNRRIVRPPALRCDPFGMGLAFGRPPKILGGAPPAFTPGSLAGLQLWLRADLGVTGSPVSAWADQSGVGDANRNAAQVTAGRRPAFNASNASYNNQPTVDFTAASLHYLITGTWSVALAQPATWIIVGHDPSATTDVVIDGIGAGNRHLVDRVDAANVGMYGGSIVVSGAGNWQSKGCVLAEFNGATSKLFFNNFTTATATGSAGAVSLTGLTIGAVQGAGAYFWNGPIAEIIAVSGLVSTGDKASLKAYLNARYATSIV